MKPSFEDQVKKTINEFKMGISKKDLDILFAKFMKTTEKKDMDNAMDYIMTHFQAGA